MTTPTEFEFQSNAAIIDTTTKESLNKETLIEMLKAHRVETASIENSEVTIQQIIPTLRRAKIKIPENFFKELSSKIGLTFLEYWKLKKIYQNELKSNLITALPYPIISKYKVIPLEIRGSNIDLAVDNPLDNNVMVILQYMFGSRKIHLRVVSSKAIDWVIDRTYQKIHKDTAMLDLYNRTPDQSAYKVLYPKQKYFIISLIVAVSVCATVSLEITIMALFAIISIDIS